MTNESHIVEERFKGDSSTNGEDGWLVCKEPPSDPALLAVFNATWQVHTIILDSNWDGPVFVGGVPKLSRYADGRPMFVCLARTDEPNP